jgi:hypothetical protein
VLSSSRTPAKATSQPIPHSLNVDLSGFDLRRRLGWLWGERETILQSALALGQWLISLAGLEFCSLGVTSPGQEKLLPGADAYIRANYPAVDGLDGLLMAYISGLAYADVNRRGTNPLTNSPAWAIETVTGSADLSLALAPVLDFIASFAAQALQGTLVLSRDADFDAITGFYRALDAQGMGAMPPTTSSRSGKACGS